MSWFSVGSLALPFQMQRHSTAMRNSVSQLSTELATGKVASPQKHLGGHLAQIAAIEARTQRLTQYETNLTFETTKATAAQSALTAIAKTSQDLASSLLSLAASGTNSANIAFAGQNARSAMGVFLGALSASVVGQNLFSGNASNRAPIASEETILDTLRPLVSTANSAADVISAITDAFSTPNGAFETVLYTGGETSAGAIIEDGEHATPLPTASNPAFRKALIAMSVGIFANDPSLSLNTQERHSLVKRSAELLLSNTSGLTALQASLGDNQGLLEAQKTRLKSEQYALTQAKQELIGADPYEVATKLQNTQTQLEAIYTITARTARLSLTEYLR